MSKYVKDLLTDQIRQELAEVKDLVVVSVAGIDANRNCDLRRELRSKDISLLVVKNSLARRATEGTVLAPAFEGLKGSAAVVWGGTDIVDLAKQVMKLVDDKKYPELEPRGGAMDGTGLTADGVKDVSTWKGRDELLSMISGQILSPGATLNGQLLGPSGALASQIKQKGDDGEDAAGEAAAE